MLHVLFARRNEFACVYRFVVKKRCSEFTYDGGKQRAPPDHLVERAHLHILDLGNTKPQVSQRGRRHSNQPLLEVHFAGLCVFLFACTLLGRPSSDRATSDQPTDPTKQLTNRPTNQLTDQANNVPTNPSTNQPTTQLSDQRINRQSINQPINQ